MATYAVIARRTGDWWALDVPDVPGAHSQSKRLDQAPSVAREAIALVLDEDEADINVTIEPHLSAEMAQRVDSFRRAREALEQTIRDTQEAQVAAIEDLVNECRLSYRDVGQIVGLSHQRVSQVLKEGSTRPVRWRAKAEA